MSRSLGHLGHDIAILSLGFQEAAVLGCDALGFMGPGLEQSWRSAAQLFLWLLRHAPLGALEELGQTAGLRTWRIERRGVPKPTNAAREDGAEPAELVHLDAVSWMAHAREAA